MITVGIIGATGYAGEELVRLLSSHPKVDALSLSSTSFEGGMVEDVYPNLRSAVSCILEKPEAVIAASDVVFSALPAGVGEAFAVKAIEKGIPFIDLSADFRFGSDEETYTAWYGKSYGKKELYAQAVYGLPELNRENIKGAKIIGNPGCYPTGTTLSLYPAFKHGLIGSGTIIADAASGVSGTGRNATETNHFCECADSISPYKVGAHRHTPEIARNLSLMAGRPVPFIFTPHLAPLSRGIISTVYAPLSNPVSGSVPGVQRPQSAAVEERAREIHALYRDFYKDEAFVRVLPFGKMAATRNVRASNYVDISIHLDQTGSTLIAVSAIDNMVKGAAGQAIQNMNIVFGYPETAGLTAIPLAF